jgi:HK97 family phage major capsid protein
MSENLEQLLSSLKTEQKSFLDKAAEEQKAHGTILTETKTKVDAIQAQVDAIDVKLATKLTSEQAQGSTLVKTFKEDEGVQRLLKDRKGHAVVTIKGSDMAELMQRKTVISDIISGSNGSDTLNPVGASTSGVLTIDRTPGIVPEARQILKLRGVLNSRPTIAQIVDFVKVSSPLAIASPVAEGALKPENSLSFATVSEKVRLLATWIPATRQVLDDFAELMDFIKTSLPYYVDKAEELQMLSGDGTGENLHGILSQASSFNSSNLPAAAKGWTKLDVVAAAIQQVNAIYELQPTFVVVHPNDWWGIRLTKTTFGSYILGDPQSLGNPTIFGLDVVVTTSIAQGTFLVGSGSPIAIEIRDRMDMQVEISTEHSDYFVRNLVAIRAEKRLALLTKRPASFVTGTFTTSP